MKTIYVYHPATGEYQYSAEVHDTFSMECSTEQVPPVPTEGQQVFFEEHGWILKEKHQKEIDLTDLSDYHKYHDKLNLRGKIYETADRDSLLGTTADAAQVLVLFACADAVALSSATTFTAYKQARMEALMQLSGNAEDAANLVKRAAELLADVQAGKVEMPFLVKPGKAAGVFDDIATRATAVAKILAPASN